MYSGSRTDRIGQQLGNYLLLRQIGQGGFSDVYLGEHIHLRTQAAIKVLQVRLGESTIQNFLKEARTIAHLVHPYIIRVLDFGVEAGTPFLVMDYAPRGTFRQRFLKGTPLPPIRLVPYMKQAAEALQYAHDRNLIHRDVKPDNMLLGAHNEILLSDFGLARIAQGASSRSRTEMAGTAIYMAPEQLQGRPCPASDQYSLGIIAYEWLTGSCPFQGSFFEIASQHMLTPPPSLRAKVPGISSELERVVLTALAKEPAQRFPSVRAFAAALQAVCASDAPSIEGIVQESPIRFSSGPTSFSGGTTRSFTGPPSQIHSFDRSRPFPASTHRMRSLSGTLPTSFSANYNSQQSSSPILTPHNISFQGQPPITSATSLPETPFSSKAMPALPAPSRHLITANKVIIFVIVLLLIVSGTLGLAYFSHPSSPATTNASTATVAQNSTAATSGGTSNQGTATAQAAARNPYPPFSGNLVLDDPLSTNNAGWQVFSDPATGNTCYFATGSYHIIRVSKAATPCFETKTDYRNFTFQVQMTFVRIGKQFSGGGIVFRGDNATKRYYAFEVYESGRFSLEECTGANCTRVLAGYPSQNLALTAFHPEINQTNTLAVVANDTTFALYVNGQFAAGPINDDALSHGMIGVYATAGSEGGLAATADVAFSNARVWQLS